MEWDVKLAYDRLEKGFWNISKVKENRIWQIKELWAVLTFLKRPFIRWINAFFALEETACYLWQQPKGSSVWPGISRGRKGNVYFPCHDTERNRQLLASGLS